MVRKSRQEGNLGKRPLRPQPEQVMPSNRALTKKERKENRTKGKITPRKGKKRSQNRKP